MKLRWKIIFVMAFFLISFSSGVIAVTLFYIPPTIFDDSFKQNFTLHISEEIKDKISSEYSMTKEDAYCLGGNKDYMNILLNPTIYYQSATNLSFSCPKEAIMLLHTHPQRICKFSTKDIFSFGAKFEQNPSLIFNGIYCGSEFIIIDRNMNKYEVL